MKNLLGALNEAEYRLILETEPAAIADLDEDALIELHTRIRRARKKYVTLYRRKGAAKVSAKGARGAARAANARNRDRAEIFEGALGRVSKQLGIVAQRTARELKAERLARARTENAPPKPPTRGGGKVRSTGRAVDRSRKSPARKKRDASSLAAGARRQARRDSR